MNQRPTSFLIRDKITFSERESRYLRYLQKKKKKQHPKHFMPEFNYGASGEEEASLIPTIDPLTPIPPPIKPALTPTSIIPTIIPKTPSSKPFDISSDPLNGRNHPNLGMPISNTYVPYSEPPTIRTMEALMEDAEEALAAFGL